VLPERSFCNTKLGNYRLQSPRFFGPGTAIKPCGAALEGALDVALSTLAAAPLYVARQSHKARKKRSFVKVAILTNINK
jgi:hypothetical protein